MEIEAGDIHLTATLDNGRTGIVYAGSFFALMVATPPQITADQNDYAGCTVSVCRLSTNAPHSITGIAGGTDGKLLLLINIGANNLVLEHDDVLSAAENRMLLGGGTARTLSPGQSGLLIYDVASTRWRITIVY